MSNLIHRFFLCLITFFILFETVQAHDHYDVSGFEENNGQWPAFIKFRKKIPGGFMYASDTCLYFEQIDLKKLDALVHAKKFWDNSTIQQHLVKLHFKNSRPSAFKTGLEPLEGYSNYILGNDSSRWASNVQMFHSVEYKNLYQGIDLILESTEDGFKYSFKVESGANPNQIQLKYEGLQSLESIDAGLKAKTSVGYFTDSKPSIDQMWGNEKVRLNCDFIVKNKTVSFHLPSNLKKNQAFVIDPQISFVTYSGSASDNWGYTATFDQQGNVYSAGIIFNGNSTTADDNGFVTTPGAFATRFAGGVTDIVITKYNKTGSQRLYSTYLGGANLEIPQSIIVDSKFNLIVLGSTDSRNFPISTNAFSRQFFVNGPQGTLNNLMVVQGCEIFISKLNPTGNRLEGSTFIGGEFYDGINFDKFFDYEPYNYGDDFRSDITVDAQDAIYVVSNSFSSTFPIRNGFQRFSGGNQDAVVFKMNPQLSSLIWSTYLGGTENEGGFSIKLDRNRRVYVSGFTSSPNFPTTAGVIKSTLTGRRDGFVSVIDSNGQSLISSTYIGGDTLDQCFFIEVDSVGDVFVLGQTWGGIPIFSRYGKIYADTGSGQFIQKISPALDTLYFSTVWGAKRGRPDLSPTGFSVNFCGQIMVSGWFGELKGPFVDTLTRINLPITSNAFQKTTDHHDYYFCSFKKNMTDLDYGSYYGGNSAEHVDGGTCRFDRNGVAYQTICGGCLLQLLGLPDRTPTTPGVVSRTNNGPNCNMLTVKFDFQYPLANAGPPQMICKGQSVTLQATGGKTYQWRNDPDIQCRTCTTQVVQPQISKYYYLLVDDGFGCKSTDSVSVEVKPQPKADFEIPYQKCNYTIPFRNSSSDFNQLNWDFGVRFRNTDTSHQLNPVFTYPQDGTYQIKLIANKDQQCSDSITKSISIKHQITGIDFDVSSVCYKDTSLLLDKTIQFSDSTLPFTRKWSFNRSPLILTNSIEKIILPDTGLYQVQLISANQNGCADTLTKSFRIWPLPSVKTNNDTIVCTGKPIFVQSKGANRYEWSVLNDTFQICRTCSAQNIAAQKPLFLEVKGSDQNGCSTKDSFRISTRPQPKSLFNILQQKCNYRVGIENLSTQSNVYRWFIQKNNVTIDSIFTDINQYIFPKDGAYTMTLITNPGAFCSDTSVQSLRFANDISGTQIQTQNQCFDDVTTFNDISQLSDGNVVRRSWYINGNLVSGLENFNFQFPDSGMHRIDLKVVNNFGCIDSVTKNLQIFPLPLTDAGEDAFICKGNILTLEAKGAQQYLWKGIPNSSCSTCTKISYVPSQNATIVLKGTNPKGCVSSDSIRLQILQKSEANFEIVQNACTKEIRLLNKTKGIDRSIWDFGVQQSNRDTSFAFEPIFTYPSDGRYQIKLISSQQNVCYDTIMKEFHLVTKLSGASIDAQSACLNSLIPIRDVSVLNKGQVVNTFWRIGNQSFQSKNLNFQPEKAGNLTLFLRVQNEQSCYDSVEKTIQIYEIPKVSLEPDFGVCAGNSKTILADVQGANTLLWTPAQSLSCSTCINPKVTPFDTKKYTLTAKNAQNCIHSDSIIVQYIPILKPQVAINPGDARCYTEPIQFSPKISGYDPFCLGPLRYKWNFGDGNIDTNAVPIHRFKSPGLYDVELQIPGRGIAKTQVKLLPEDSCFTNIWVPNAFSPNNDQQNDVLYVRGINVRSLQFRLYNRWGELVFETNQLSKGWDGRYKEEICSPQSFVYTLEATFIDNRSISSKGNISIVP